jgi:hypothetical protein
MILLWGLLADGPMVGVKAALTALDAPFVFLDQRAVLQSSLEVEADGSVAGRLQTPDWVVDLEDITAVYLRPYDARCLAPLKDLTPGDPLLHRAFLFEDLLTAWTEISPALVLNRPSAMASNNSKPYQLQLIRGAGLDVPETLVTTDPSAAISFQRQYGEVIYKSTSGVRSIVTRLKSEVEDSLANIANCPTQFQQYIEGTDFRVHVVGGQIFECAIHSTADDYRYPARQGANVLIQAEELPEDVAERCRELVRLLNLPFAGIDLRRTTMGSWYCFEVNPSPGFTFYEEATGQPISAAVARLLAQLSESSD